MGGGKAGGWGGLGGGDDKGPNYRSRHFGRWAINYPLVVVRPNELGIQIHVGLKFSQIIIPLQITNFFLVKEKKIMNFQDYSICCQKISEFFL